MTAHPLNGVDTSMRAEIGGFPSEFFGNPLVGRCDDFVFIVWTNMWTLAVGICRYAKQFVLEPMLINTAVLVDKVSIFDLDRLEHP